ncbi:MAG: KH domain-containing protein [Clostridia bacterium]|nr:KH domain-containing protein [Clostridia bacterium]
MKEILETIIKNLVDNPDEVVITETTNAKSMTCYEVKVAKDDMGKVIGKQGRMAKAIRSVIKAVSAHEHKKVTVEFLD